MEKGAHLALKESFVIPDLKGESIDGILGRMDSLIFHFKKHLLSEGNLLPFLETYYIVTKAVIDKRLNKKRYFNDNLGLEKLDIAFASMYFNPLKDFVLNRKIKAPWKTYYSYCGKKDGTPFLQMLIGINAHINGDLAVSLYNTHYKNKHDFLKINRVLKESIPSVFEMLSLDKKDLISVSGIFLKDFFEEEFVKIVVRWRKNAWENYKKMNKKNFKASARQIHEQTESVSHELIKIFDDFYHLRDLDHIRKRLEALSVSI